MEYLMKTVAITAHLGTVGSALAHAYSQLGYEVVGISRTTGFDLCDTEQRKKALKKIIACDIFVNTSVDQINLLHDVWAIWEGVSDKRIVNISSINTLFVEKQSQNLNCKRKLETVHWQYIMRHKYPLLTLLKTGVHETDDQTFVNWAKFAVSTIENSQEYAVLELTCLKLD